MSVPQLPSMKGLQAIALLARTGSLTAAAGELGVTRSALSHRIADLELQLGVTLVRTLGRKAVLTDGAESLLAVMGDALDRIGAAIEPLHRRRSQLRVSTVATFASLWLLPRLPAFQARHPNIDWRFRPPGEQSTYIRRILTARSAMGRAIGMACDRPCFSGKPWCQSRLSIQRIALKMLRSSWLDHVTGTGSFGAKGLVASENRRDARHFLRPAPKHWRRPWREVA